MKERIENLEVVYKFGPAESSPWCAREKVVYVKTGPANRSMYARTERDWPPVVHPLVFAQPATGRKALNLSPRFFNIDCYDSALRHHTLYDFPT